jgi:prophage maintenance system killer protein
MEELNAERIIDIHDDIVKDYGGTGGLLTQGTLEQLVYKDDEIVELMRKIAQYQHTVKTIADWIKEKAKATSAPIF